jgi:hypothetical protein
MTGVLALTTVFFAGLWIRVAVALRAKTGTEKELRREVEGLRKNLGN